MRAPWPPGFVRIPDEPWTRAPVESLAEKYDTVENHGWYSNLDKTVADARALVREASVVVDYSGGTGIFAERLLAEVGEANFGLVVVDASPKFLRLALEKLGGDPRVAFRLLAWRRDERRLDALDEVLDLRADLVVSTNAVHLYADLAPTFAGWHRASKPGARGLVQSGNVRGEGGRWILDDTVAAVDGAARAIAAEDEAFARWRPVLADAGRMRSYDAYRARVFPPPRPRAAYERAFAEAGWRVRDVATRPVEAKFEEWLEFLQVYHDAVLAWAGGTEKLDAKPPTEDDVRLRLVLLERALERALGGRAPFEAEWTYFELERM